jgi:type IV pilus assembly protein PilE
MNRIRTKDSPCQQGGGFSLIELMAALIVAAVLAAAAYPSYGDAVRRAKRAEGRAALLQAMRQQEAYYSRHQAYAAFSVNRAQGFKWYSGASPAASAYELSAAACAGQTLGDCVLLTARPGTGPVDSSYRDQACGVLSLASTGAQAASGATADCW